MRSMVFALHMEPEHHTSNVLQTLVLIFVRFYVVNVFIFIRNIFHIYGERQ